MEAKAVKTIEFQYLLSDNITDVTHRWFGKVVPSLRKPFAFEGCSFEYNIVPDSHHLRCGLCGLWTVPFYLFGPSMSHPTFTTLFQSFPASPHPPFLPVNRLPHPTGRTRPRAYGLLIRRKRTWEISSARSRVSNIHKNVIRPMEHHIRKLGPPI